MENGGGNVRSDGAIMVLVAMLILLIGGGVGLWVKMDRLEKRVMEKGSGQTEAIMKVGDGGATGGGELVMEKLDGLTEELVKIRAELRWANQILGESSGEVDLLDLVKESGVGSGSAAQGRP